MILNILFLVFNLLFLSVYSSISSTNCNKITTCKDCIRVSNECKWCSKDDFNGIYRCISIDEKFKDSDCDGFLENPRSISHKSKNQNFSFTSPIIQIQPQQYNIKLRAEDSIAFDFSYKGARDYPAYLYFLFDASISMLKVKNALANASEQIYNEMKSNTKNVYLGLGSFIDKNALPFTDKVSSNKSIYSFRHGLDLTSNYSTFKDAVENLAVNTNKDAPEGGLDALAQVMACDEKIGWKSDSRKIIIFVTDDSYHSAGDGRWAGITRTYDGKCYMDEDKYYSKELDMDYPTLGMIKKLAKDKGVTVLFFVKQDKNDYVVNAYKYLTEYLPRSKLIVYSFKPGDDKIEFGSNNELQTTLRDIYKKLSEDIIITTHIMPTEAQDHLMIEIDPNCNKPTLDCTVKTDEVKHFRGQIELLKTYAGPDKIQVQVTVGVVEEKLRLEIYVYNCDCETNSSAWEVKSDFCNKGGTKKCGICECDPNRNGDKCLCPTNEVTHTSDVSSCVKTGSSDVCSGHGTCACGTCSCHPGYEGKYCECNMYSCPTACTSQGFVCNCGVCVCPPHLTGDTCDCSLRECPKHNGKECNGRGVCECASCHCDPPATWDARAQNETNCAILPCPECNDSQCEKLSPCATCHHNGKQDCSEYCGGIPVEVKQNLTDITLGLNMFRCSNARASVGCYIQFIYRYDDDKYAVELIVPVKSEENCEESAYIIGLTCLGTLLLVGIVTVVAWKVLTDARDRREYSRFLKESGAGAPSLNPIYEPATTMFQNPAFRKPSVDVL